CQQVTLTVEIFTIHAYRPLLISGQVVQTEHIVSTGIGGAAANQYCFTEAFTQHAPQSLKPHTMQAYARGACLAGEAAALGLFRRSGLAQLPGAPLRSLCTPTVGRVRRL